MQVGKREHLKEEKCRDVKISIECLGVVSQTPKSI